jgi:integrase
MLHVYRRHKKRCLHLLMGRDERDCSCRLWADGRRNGKRIHKALKTADWDTAQRIVRDWEAEGSFLPGHLRPPERMTLEGAWRRFLADLVARNLHASTVRKYRLLSRQMTEFANQRRLRFFQQFDLPTLSEFRGRGMRAPSRGPRSLKGCVLSSVSLKRVIGRTTIQLANLRDLKCRFVPRCLLRGKRWSRFWELLDPYIEQTAPRGKDNARRLRSLVLVLRYSGMRIGDVVQLTTDQIAGNKRMVYTQKTGVPVN